MQLSILNKRIVESSLDLTNLYICIIIVFNDDNSNQLMSHYTNTNKPLAVLILHPTMHYSEYLKVIIPNVGEHITIRIN